MKIELKINNDKISAVHKVLKEIHQHNMNVGDTSVKVITSIWFDVADKFEKKYNSKVRNQDMFDGKKLTKFTLKYHEAWALQSILVDFSYRLQNEFEITLCRKVINTLNQKLT